MQGTYRVTLGGAARGRWVRWVAVVCALGAGAGMAQEREINTTPFTRTFLRATNPLSAAAALGFSTNVTVGTNITVTTSNIYTSFDVPFLTIGQGTNTMTLTPTNGSLVADVPWYFPEASAGAITLGGVRRTTWPEGGTNIYTVGSFSGGIVLYTSFQTNFATVASLTNLGLFTNGWFDASWTSTNGAALGLEASTNGVDWSQAEAGTNSVYLRLVVSLGSPGGGTPAVSNMVIRSIANKEAFGGTNDFRRTLLLADPPASGEQVANKEYVDDVALRRAMSWSTHPAAAPVRLLGQELQISGEWAIRTLVVSNELRAVLQFGGATIAEFSPGFTALTNATIDPATNTAWLTLRVPTNGLTLPLRVLMATNFTTGPWRYVTATNGTAGTNYTLNVPRSLVPDTAFFYVGRSNAPAYRLPALTLP
jgi:hypothetical protein